MGENLVAKGHLFSNLPCRSVGRAGLVACRKTAVLVPANNTAFVGTSPGLRTHKHRSTQSPAHRAVTNASVQRVPRAHLVSYAGDPLLPPRAAA